MNLSQGCPIEGTSDRMFPTPFVSQALLRRDTTLKGWSLLTMALRKTTDKELFSDSESFQFCGLRAPWALKSRCLSARVDYGNDDW